MTYEYTCKECGHKWDADQSIKDEPLTTCEKCGKETAQRLISQSTFVLKGSWASTGYS